MTPERWARIEAVYLAALEFPEAERARYLAAECAGDPELLAEVRRLLDRPAPSATFIEPPTSGSLDQALEPNLSGHNFDDFELLERIGSGGMGTVYRARQRSLAREVALKLLPPAPHVEEQHRRRFDREPLATARLRHPNVVEVYAVGTVGDVPYFAMELIRGPDLSREIHRLRERAETTGAALPSFESVGYFAFVARAIAEVADALQHAHDRGVVHRDVKPSNLLLDENGHIRVVDFGLARNETLGTITRSHEQFGTPHYMSPEQVRASLRVVDARTDVYSLGVVLYELLTLRRPFEGASSAEIFDQIVNREPPPLRVINPRVPCDLEIVCRMAMARELPDRYATAGELRDDLTRFVDHQAIRARVPSLARRAQAFARRHRVALMVVAVAAIALVTGERVSSVRARAAEHRETLDALARLEALPDWTDAAAQVADGYSRCCALDAVEDLPSELASLKRRLHTRFVEDRDARVEQGRRLLRLGLGGAGLSPAYAGHLSGPSERDLARALLAFNQAFAIYSDDAELRELAAVSTTFPRVTLRLASGAALTAPQDARLRLTICPVDPLIGTCGEPTELWTATVGEARDRALIEQLPVPPGNWRFVVDVEGYGSSEHTRDLYARSQPFEVVSWVRPDSEALARMHRVEAGRYVADGEKTPGCDVFGSYTEHDEFWIDEREVSNGEYLEFLRATGHSPPRAWLDLGFVDDWHVLPLGAAADSFLELPITGIEYADAQLFAEWSGRRLPTHLELERALRGGAGCRFPSDGWSVVADAGDCNVNGADVYSAVRYEDSFDLYLNSVRRVDDERYRQLPECLIHAFGNVAEYTESLVAEPCDGILFEEPHCRVALGASWDAVANGHSLTYHAVVGLGPRHASHFIGIRCARSARRSLAK